MGKDARLSAQIQGLEDERKKLDTMEPVCVQTWSKTWGWAWYRREDSFDITTKYIIVKHSIVVQCGLDYKNLRVDARSISGTIYSTRNEFFSSPSAEVKVYSYTRHVQAEQIKHLRDEIRGLEDERAQILLMTT